MSTFEYISVLSSIIIGLGITQLLRGAVRIIHHREEAKPYLIHLLWVASTFLLAIVWWWFQFTLNELELWTFQNYCFLIAYAVIVYLMCAILIPSSIASFDSYKDFFISKKSWFFGILILQRIVDVLDTLMKGGLDRLYSFGPVYNIGVVLQIVLAGVAIYSRNEKFHIAFVSLILLQQIVMIVQLFPTMG